MEKGFTIRELTARGWTRREDLDFRDDGNKFKVFEYKNGLLASYTKVNGDYYLSLRLDYLDGLSYDEYSKMDSYELTNEFNGVPEVDADKVTENAVKIMEEYNKVLEEVNVILNTCYKEVMELLKEHETLLREMARVLIEKEVMTLADFEEVLARVEVKSE